MTEPGTTCANCDTPLVGDFCHACGQEATERRVPLRTLVHDALGDLLTFDSRIVRTLVPLLARPGFLTAEWCRGRRTRYVPPVRLYVFVAAFFFVVLALTDAELVTIDEDGRQGPRPAGASETRETAANERTDVSEPTAATAATAATDGTDASDASDGSDASEAADAGGVGEAADASEATAAAEIDEVERRLVQALRQGRGVIQERFRDRFGKLSLLLPPVLAAFLALAYRGRRRFFVEHLVLSLHEHAFAFLVLAAVNLAPLSEPVVRLLVPAIFLGLGLRLYLAMRRVYGGRHLATLLRLGLTAVLYLVLGVLPVIGAAFFWTLWTFPATE